MTEQASSELNPFQSDIVEAVIESWTRNNSILPLARLGQVLSGRGYNVRAELGGRKLAQVILRDLAAHVQIIQNPADPLQVAAAPAGVRFDDLAAAFAPNAAKAASAAETRIPKFNRAVWIAFTRKLPAGLVRTLSLEPRPNFQDVSPEAAAAAGKYRIEQSDIVVTEGDEPSVEIQAETGVRITRWAERIGIPTQSLLARASPSVPLVGDGAAGASLLSRVLSVLTPEEQRSVNLPLNVVKKLLSAQ